MDIAFYLLKPYPFAQLLLILSKRSVCRSTDMPAEGLAILIKKRQK